MGEQKHTALPWRVTEDERGQIIRATDSTGKPIASMWANGNDPKENAALIVRAVNTYPAVADLVEALEHCQSALAMVIAPDAIKSSTVMHAFAQAIEAECKARTALSRFEKAGKGGDQ